MTPPDSRQPRWSEGRRDPSRPPGASPDGDRGRDGTDAADETRLAPAEQARIDESVVRLGPSTAAPLIVAALVIAAFVLGLVRPWDWLARDPGSAIRRGGNAAGRTFVPGDGTVPAAGEGSPATGDTAVPEPVQAPTCGFPTGWRTASISFWAGARARIWTAARAVQASGPADPSIPFNPLASDTVEALGWCAPINGPERPPLNAEGTLFRLRDGVATKVEVDRLEPAARDALGELWMPTAQTAGKRPAWSPGRYVVRLATPSGSYARYLGLEVGTTDATPTPSPGASAPAAPS